ncbi:MAG: hypothetical protein JSR77_10545 [Planctomycetes bacterium]|nr:hypothetical protein [Planctomycetota bacterium]
MLLDVPGRVFGSNEIGHIGRAQPEGLIERSRRLSESPSETPGHTHPNHGSLKGCYCRAPMHRADHPNARRVNTPTT